MSAIGALLVLVVALGGGLFLLPWVGFMAVFVALALSGSIIGHFWSKYYLTPVAWVAVEMLGRPSVERLLPRGSWRLALVALMPWLVAIFIIPGLVSTLVLGFLNSGGSAHFVPGALFGFGLTGLTAILHPLCPISGCD